MIASGCNVYAANHSLELDKRVSLIVEIGRASLATGAEVGVMADGTLIAVSNNVRRLVTTERSITIDAMVTSLAESSSTDLTDWFIDRDKAMSRVDEA
jgi:hypothetical protein